jgi:AraC-like DNA-binding protein
LYNSAVNSTLVLDLGHALYVGPLGAIPEHRASVSALLVGMEATFDLIVSGSTQTHRMAHIKSQTLHALDAHGGRVAVFYFDPGIQLRNSFDDITQLIAAIERALSPKNREAWYALLAYVRAEMLPAQPEPRLGAIALRLIQSSGEAPGAKELAASAQLSVSRLEHLFKAQFGVPLGAFKNWYRFRLAVKHLLNGNSITEAAHAAGFHDSAHLSHAFRDTFGLPPSQVFTASLQGHCWD